MNSNEEEQKNLPEIGWFKNCKSCHCVTSKFIIKNEKKYFLCYSCQKRIKKKKDHSSYISYYSHSSNSSQSSYSSYSE